MSAGREALVRQDSRWLVAVRMVVIASRSQDLSPGVILGPQIKVMKSINIDPALENTVLCVPCVSTAGTRVAKELRQDSCVGDEQCAWQRVRSDSARSTSSGAKTVQRPNANTRPSAQLACSDGQ